MSYTRETDKAAKPADKTTDKAEKAEKEPSDKEVQAAILEQLTVLDTHLRQHVSPGEPGTGLGTLLEGLARQGAGMPPIPADKRPGAAKADDKAEHKAEHKAEEGKKPG